MTTTFTGERQKGRNDGRYSNEPWNLTYTSEPPRGELGLDSGRESVYKTRTVHLPLTVDVQRVDV